MVRDKHTMTGIVLSVFVVFQASVWTVNPQKYGNSDPPVCDEASVHLNTLSPGVTVLAPSLTSESSACLLSLACTWLVTSEPGSSIFVRILKENPKPSFVGFDLDRENEVSIGIGHDPSAYNTTVARIDLTQVPHLDDGRVYFVNSSLAWVEVTAHARGPPSCVKFEMIFTQREKPGICDGNTVLCLYSSVCLPASAYCDSFVDCGDFSDQIDCKMCGNTSIPLLTPGVPQVLVYASSWTPKPAGRLNPPHTDCFWYIQAPNDSIIEINVISSNGVGPAISLGVASEKGVNEAAEKLFEVPPGLLQILYTNITSLWMVGDISPIEYYRTAVCEIKITAFTRQECGPDEFQCQNQECVAVTRRCDGEADCSMKEDEYGCGINCSFMCPEDGSCVNVDRVCDGFRNCPYSWDEFDCGRYDSPYIDLSPGETVSVTHSSDTTEDGLWLVSASSNHSRIRVEVLNLPIYEFYIDWNPNMFAGLYFGNGNRPSLNTFVRSFVNVQYQGTVSFEGPRIWILFAKLKHGRATPGRHYMTLNITEYSEKDCAVDQYSCLSGTLCINASQVCNSRVDCPEYDDEYDCGVCGADKFRCSDGSFCLEKYHVCDHYHSCYDSSDEKYCEPCGEGTIDLSSGPHSLKSIGYPGSYPPNTMCYWNFRAEPNHGVLVVFHDFQTEEFQDLLFLGNETKWLANVTGNRHPQRAALNHSNVWLSFVTDFIYEYKGFEISVEQVVSASCNEGEVACNHTDLLFCILEERVCDAKGDCPQATDEQYCGDICGETLIDVPRSQPYELTSPLYHLRQYPGDTTCLWLFRTAGSRDDKIKLDVLDFHLEQNFDFLRIGVGNDSSRGLAASLTGQTKIVGISFESDEVWLRMDTDQLVSAEGFRIALTAIDKRNFSQCVERCVLPDLDNTVICLQRDAFCNGFADCPDGGDEQGCVNVSCSSDQYLCAGKRQCVLQESICDGKFDCEFQDDEEECEIRGCPDGCECALVDAKLEVICERGWNSTTLSQLTAITAVLELTGGNKTTLDEGMFKRFGMLRTLSLRKNDISEIKLRAFAGLRNLTILDISENSIRQINGGIFSDLRLLQVLGMRHVPVHLIKAQAFEGLKNLHTLILMLGDGSVDVDDLNQKYSSDWKIEDGALTDLASLQKVYVDDHRLCCDFRSVLPSDDQCINIQLQSPLFNCGRLMPNPVLQVFMWILGCSALFGNMLVIVWRMREDSGKGSKYVHSFLVLNLAMSDFLMGVYMVIIATVDAIEKEKYYLTATQWRNSALCKAAGVISVLSSEASVFFITLISVDRYLCIVHPFSRVRLQETSVWVSVASIWLASLVAGLVPTILATGDSDIYGLSDVCIGLPLLTRPVDYTFTKDDVGGSLGNDTYLIPKPVGSRPTWAYSIVLFLGVNFMCFVAITVSYIAIFAKVKRSVRRVKLRSHKAEEIKMASKMAVIVGSDCLCWMPVIVLGILSQTSVIQIKPEAYAWLVVFVLPINSSLNPYLYTIVTAISQRRQAHLASAKSASQKPTVYSIPEMSTGRKEDSTSWTTVTPTGSVNLGYSSLDVEK
ncbi:uncharacterized protein LOC110990004 [Acanthaster planci]|uniref:Uncharacterized protein LOC110990004 n=1 Tax=Acanthaster planci TaxID=133434 RepID=A0A8B7ZZC1_ACAPL|nr:uncharacterized protein LOC110990004 [Acanthaster planci]